MQPLEAYSAELQSLGIAQSVEGQIEAELMRRFRADAGLAAYFRNGMFTAESEELPGSEVTGAMERTLYLTNSSSAEERFPADSAELTTTWVVAMFLPRRPESTGTQGAARAALASRLKSVILAEDGDTATGRGALADTDGNIITDHLVDWSRIDSPRLHPSGSLLVSVVTFRLLSRIGEISRELQS